MMRTSIESFDELVSSIYRAAEDPSEWAACLERIRVALDGSGMTLMHHDASAHRRDIGACVGYGEDSIALYRGYYNQLDPWGRALTTKDLVSGQVVDGRSLVSKTDVLRTEYYVDFGRHIGSAQSLFGSIESSAERTSLIIVARAANQPGFTEKDVTLLRRLMPHLRQAFRLHRRITAADGVRASSCDALDRLPCGVVLVDRRGRPVFVNSVARRIADRRDSVTIDQDGVRALDAAGTARLARAVARAIDAEYVPANGAMESAFTLEKISGGAGLRVVVAPVGYQGDGLGREAGAAAAVFLGDPDRRVIEHPERLVDFFGFTRAEARIAAHLADGVTIAGIATILGLKTSTVRWYTKQILQKAGVGTQAQLVSLVLRMPTVLGGSSPSGRPA